MLLLFTVSAAATGEVNTIHPGCPSACGAVAVPYPFGIGANCSMSGFELTCDKSKRGMYGHYAPFLGDVEVKNINLSSGQVRVDNHMSWACHNGNDGSTVHDDWQLDFKNGPYRFSVTLNKLTTLGCDTLAYIVGSDGEGPVGFHSGCWSECQDAETSMWGWCQTSIPQGLNYYQVRFDERFNSNKRRCGYAFLSEASFVSEGFLSDEEDLFLSYESSFRPNDTFIQTPVPLVLDWAIGINGCQPGFNDSTPYACLSEHSECFDSTNGLGYRCTCSSGYEGNPYLRQGCQDINECDHPEEYSCYGRCSNFGGNFSCTCPPGTKGNPRTQGSCKEGSKKISLWLGIIIGLLCIFVLAIFAHLVYERVKLIRAKRKCFQQNGGLLLQEQINAHQGVKFKIFTIEEIKRATNNFDASRVLGEGGHGLVYKGSLTDDREVAIKISRIADQKQRKEFAKEMYIGSLINHRNVVNILGCCLEVEVPMLVYEFVPKGDLFKYIHIKKGPIPLEFRLKVVGESAAALAYLHTDASPPILHGDVKSSNILLDEGYTAKVSDFGASLLDKDQLATHAQGTWGYIDPEYAQTCLLTDKSDVYSFAVVLLEVFTRKKVVLADQSGAKIGLVSVFLSSARENSFRELLDSEIRHELGNEQVEEMAEMLTRCLSPSGETRPAMREVAAWVESLRKYIRSSSSSTTTHDFKLDEGNGMNSGKSSSFWTADSTIYTSTESRMTFSIGSGRY